MWTRLVELSGHALSKMDLRELARPRLTQLMDTTGLLCHLGIIDNGSAYYILKVEHQPLSACVPMKEKAFRFIAPE